MYLEITHELVFELRGLMAPEIASYGLDPVDPLPTGRLVGFAWYWGGADGGAVVLYAMANEGAAGVPDDVQTLSTLSDC